jgi:hypothetical protein
MAAGMKEPDSEVAGSITPVRAVTECPDIEMAEAKTRRLGG